MNIIINIDDREIKIILKDKNEIIDEFSWEEDQNLSQRLLVEIDNLLSKNKLKPSEIKKMQVETGIPDKFTTVRIAKVVAKTFNFFNE
jgi:tRNA A37 threonylcarbamoyladenosine modification protein TsaB